MIQRARMHAYLFAMSLCITFGCTGEDEAEATRQLAVLKRAYATISDKAEYKAGFDSAIESYCEGYAVVLILMPKNSANRLFYVFYVTPDKVFHVTSNSTGTETNSPGIQNCEYSLEVIVSAAASSLPGDLTKEDVLTFIRSQQGDIGE